MHLSLFADTLISHGTISRCINLTPLILPLPLSLSFFHQHRQQYLLLPRRERAYGDLSLRVRASQYQIGWRVVYGIRGDGDDRTPSRVDRSGIPVDPRGGGRDSIHRTDDVYSRFI